MTAGGNTEPLLPPTMKVKSNDVVLLFIYLFVLPLSILLKEELRHIDFNMTLLAH